MKRYEIETYVTESGTCPFDDWRRSLKDARAKLAVMARIERATTGDFGDWKSLTGAKGIFEMRIHYAQGYRLFYTIVGSKIVLLLAGSSKSEQERTIAKAKGYLEDYNRRAKT